jgi:hypothetical protein
MNVLVENMKKCQLSYKTLDILLLFYSLIFSDLLYFVSSLSISNIRLGLTEEKQTSIYKV